MTTCLSVILTTVPVTTDFFRGQVLRGCGFGGLLAVEACERGGEVGVVVVAARGSLFRRLSGGGERRCDLAGGRVFGRGTCSAKQACAVCSSAE